MNKVMELGRVHSFGVECPIHARGSAEVWRNRVRCVVGQKNWIAELQDSGGPQGVPGRNIFKRCIHTGCKGGILYTVQSWSGELMCSNSLSLLVERADSANRLRPCLTPSAEGAILRLLVMGGGRTANIGKQGFLESVYTERPSSNATFQVKWCTAPLF